MLFSSIKKIFIILFIAVNIFCAIGYVINFQNIFEYWPITDKFADTSFEWIMSFIGIFIPPIGSVTGWLY
jgi:hypothetical protein